MKPHYIMTDLKEIRRANGMTQERVAGIAGYNRAQIIRYEAGADSPRLSTLSNLAEALGYELVLRPMGKRS